VTTTLAPSNVATTDFNDNAYAFAFLKLINATNPTGKVLDVVPVLRSDEVAAAFHEFLVEAAETDFKEYIKLTMPVLYESSEYPKSDAFKVVSEIGARVALSPFAQVLVVSPKDLVHLLETAHINRSLRKRRWFARDAIQVEEKLR
jgi:hypothetical protein